jgi:hypothetical protein
MQIQPEPAVNRVVVGRQHDGARVHELFKDRHGLIHRSHRQDCGLVRQLIDLRYPEQVRLHGALEVEVVVELVGGGLIRDAAVEAERAQARLDLAGDRHVWRHLGRVLVLRVRGGTRQRPQHGYARCLGPAGRCLPSRSARDGQLLADLDLRRAQLVGPRQLLQCYAEALGDGVEVVARNHMISGVGSVILSLGVVAGTLIGGHGATEGKTTDQQDCRWRNGCKRTIGSGAMHCRNLSVAGSMPIYAANRGAGRSLAGGARPLQPKRYYWMPSAAFFIPASSFLMSSGDNCGRSILIVSLLNFAVSGKGGR